VGTKLTAPEVSQFRKTAEGLLQGAKQTALTPHAKFILAYESVHSLCLAILSHHGYLPGKEKGHRTIVLQAVAGHLGLTGDQFELLSDAHNIRNERTYRVPLPPVTRAYAEDFIELTDDFHAKAKVVEPGIF
jgi:hypothetical protein